MTNLTSKRYWPASRRGLSEWAREHRADGASERESFHGGQIGWAGEPMRRLVQWGEQRRALALAEAAFWLHVSSMDHHLNEPAARAAVEAVEASAAALTAALGRAAELGIPMEVEILAADHGTGRREIVARIVRSETGRRPEDLNSSNDD